MTHPLIPAVRAAAAAQPDRYADCRYITRKGGDVQPECIIGHALVAVGLDLLTLDYLDQRTDATAGSECVVGLVTGATGQAPTIAEVWWLDDVQRFQDQSEDPKSWSEAVRLADLDAQEHDPGSIAYNHPGT